MIRKLVAMLLLCLLPGCAAISRQTHPDRTLERYVAAIEAGDYDAAYDLLSREQQARVSREEFRRAAEEQAEEVRDQARQLRRQMAEPVPVRAEIQGPGGETATFVLEEGRWRIAEGAAGSVALDTPIQAVRALRRSLQRRSYQAILRVLGREARAVLEDEISRVIEGLSDEEELRVEVMGNRARILYDENHFLDLVREDGEWVVVDID